jgi:hypothetical protein
MFCQWPSGGTIWAASGHLAREKQAQQPVRGHARDVPYPPEESAVVVVAGRVEAKALVKGLRRMV